MSGLELPVLDTERLRVRPLLEEDLEVCHALFTSIGWVDPARTDEENRGRTREWLAWQVRTYVQLDRLVQPPYGDRAIVLKASNDVVGLLGLVPSLERFDRLAAFGSAQDALRRPEVGLFWALHPDHRGHGYATEAARAMASYAFDHLHLERLVATTERDNVASLAVMRRLGMEIEAFDPHIPPEAECVGILVRPPDGGGP